MAHVFTSPWRTTAAVATLSCCIALSSDSGTETENGAAQPSPVLAEGDTAGANRMLQGVPSPFVPNLGQWAHDSVFPRTIGPLQGGASNLRR